MTTLSDLLRPICLLADTDLAAPRTGWERLLELVKQSHPLAWGILFGGLSLWLMLPRGAAKGRSIGAVLGIAALGCLASALTSNQIVAAMISLVLTIGIFFLTLINYVINSSSPFLRDITAYVAQLDHMDSFSRGVLDSRVFVFYPSMTLLLLVMTYQVFQYRRWRA